MGTAGHAFVGLGVLLAVAPEALAAGSAPGAPGAPSHWAPSQKSFLGTSAQDGSRVYFTGYRGILSEIFYPVLDTVDTVELQFLVGDRGRTFLDEEKQQDYLVTRPIAHSLRWQVVTSNVGHHWRITKQVFTDANRDALVVRTKFEALHGRKASDFNLYVFHDPAMDNSGQGNTSRTLVVPSSGLPPRPRPAPRGNPVVASKGRVMLVASRNSRASALAISAPWVGSAGTAMVSNGFVGKNDGLTDLLGGSADKTMDWSYDQAATGNVAQLGWIDLQKGPSPIAEFELVLAFGASEKEATSTASLVLQDQPDALQSLYDSQWQGYAASLDDQGATADDQYYLAAMCLKASQDKSNGAMIAGMGTPWGATQPDSNRGGYHLVWGRDLFKFANALVTAGDLASAARVVNYLFGTLQERSDCGATEEDAAGCPQGYTRRGRFPQNAWISGVANGHATQLDEQAMPILLAWRVWQKGDADIKKRMNAWWPRIQTTADYIVSVGPWTQQERWEENSGYSPSTIAAEIAGLVAAAEFAQMNADLASAGRYLAAADYWQQNVAAWTFTKTGSLGNGKYYLRLNPSMRAKTGSGPKAFDPAAGPDSTVTYEIRNGVGARDQRAIVDGGFLELVRMGVKRVDDDSILESLPEYDAILRQQIAGKWYGWFRYNFDGYGEQNDGRPYDDKNGRGRLWPILTAERGMYEIAATHSGASGTPYLDSLKAFSTAEGLIPEQVWNTSTNIMGWQVTTPPPDVPGTPSRSMTPLNWAMGEYISLMASIHAAAVVDVPRIVCTRYFACVAPPAPGQVALRVNVSAKASLGQHVYLTGNAAALGNWATDLGLPLDSATYPSWKQSVNLPASTAIEYRYYRKNPDGSVTWESLPRGGNRVLTTVASGSQSLNDTVAW